MAYFKPLPADSLEHRDWTREERAAVQVVLDGYRALVGATDPAAVAAVYAAGYRDHASTVPEGNREALIDMVRRSNAEHPNTEIELLQVLADGDRVTIHSRGRRAAADGWDGIMEIFRVDDGLIAEHWETIEPAGFFDSADPERADSEQTTTVTVTAADGTPIAVHVAGPDGGDPLVLLHGVASSSLTYGWLLPHLTDRRIYLIDFRGHGSSGQAPGTYSLNHYFDDVALVLEQVVRRPAVVAGFSLGGMVAWRLAQQRPDLLLGVLLEEPIVYTEDTYSGHLPELLRRTIEQEMDWEARGLDLDAATAELGRNPAGPGVTMSELLHPDSVRALAASTMIRDRGTMGAAIDGSMSVGIDPRSPLRVPAVIVAGSDAGGSVFPTGDEAKVAADHPDIPVVRVAGAGHDVHNSFVGRDIYLKLLRDFLSSTPAPAGA